MGAPSRVKASSVLGAQQWNAAAAPTWIVEPLAAVADLWHARRRGSHGAGPTPQRVLHTVCRAA
jgi:hypothetical protein